MTITLDKVTEEMLKAIMKKEGKYDGKKYISEKIKTHISMIFRFLKISKELLENGIFEMPISWFMCFA